MNVREGDIVKLLGGDGKILDGKYLVTQLHKRVEITFHPVDNPRDLRKAHKSRVAEVVDSSSKIVEDQQQPKTTTQKKKRTKVTVKKTEKTTTKTKTRAKKQEIQSFNVRDFVKEVGGRHWLKDGIEFDHDTHVPQAHMVLDLPNGTYYTFNTYKYPNGTISLGKKGMGSKKHPGNKYALKGKKIQYIVKNGGGTRIQKGTKTGDEVIALYEKKGYKEK